jgi:hypothetical protein
MKKILISAAVVAALLGSTAAFAASNSTPGGDRYENNQGRQQATEVGAQCGSGAGSGAFGYLGKDLNPGQETWDGGNGTKPGTTSQTGDNNSAVCGNENANP